MKIKYFFVSTGTTGYTCRPHRPLQALWQDFFTAFKLEKEKHGIMAKRGSKIALMVISTVLLLWSGCTLEQDFIGSSQVIATFRLKSPQAMEGKITVNDAYLKLERIEVTGTLSGKSNPLVSHSVDPDEPPYQLTKSDSAQAIFGLSSKAYDQLDLNLFLFQDNYELMYVGRAKPEPSGPPGEETGQDTDHSTGGQQGNTGGNTDNGGQQNEGNNEGTGGQGNTGDSDNHNEDQGGNTGNDGDDSEDEDKDSEDKNDKKDDKKKNKGKHKDKKHRGDDDDDDEDDDDDDEDDDDDDDEDDDDEDDDDEDDDGRKLQNNDAQVVDLDHFFQNAKPGMLVFGTYQNNGKDIRLIFAITRSEKFTVRGTQNDNTTIILGNRNHAEVVFDPESWFATLAPEDIESAQTQVYQQQEVLFIHPDHNTALYEALLDRIESSANLNFSLPGSGNF